MLLTDSRVLIAAICLLLLGGCGRFGPEIVRVEGQVTYGGGPWPKMGKIYFVPAKMEASVPARPGSATFDTDGRFRVTCSQSDGLSPGVYRVSLECWEKQPTILGPPPRNYVPTKYQSPQSSGLEVTVPSGQRQVDVSFDIPKK